ncbi:transcriptional regulator [Rahnella sp. PCH160]|uniref:transcriptional regulator n=1 Tax=Rahnella sp. PCH160 TaxID=3447928 RepID=UPI0039FDC4A8
MHNHYIINGVVEFHPATSTLRDLNDPDHVVVLNSPAGRCLLLLIERTGTIVTQHEFLDIVWAQRGMLVSSNTFYQNISILRKGLKKIGLPDDPVVTIPRIGLTLASGTHIKKLTTDQQVEVSHENAHFIDEHSLTQELKTLQPPEDVPEEDVPEPATETPAEGSPESPATEPKPVRRCTRRQWLTGSASALVVLMLLGAAVLALRSNDESHFFSHYHFLKTTQGCHIFLSDGIISPESRANALERSKQIADGCKSYPWLYVTHLPLLPRTSVIRCDKPMSEPNTCISDYFFEDK